MKNILIVGSDGFIGFNLAKKITSEESYTVFNLNRDISYDDELYQENYDVVIYCAGVNRGSREDFYIGNENLLNEIINRVNFKKIIYLSTALIDKEWSSHKEYIVSKLACESILKNILDKEVHILRLPNVFGIWSRPNYNSFLHTLVYKISRGEEYIINNTENQVELLHIDDLCESIKLMLNNDSKQIILRTTNIDLHNLELKIKSIKNGLKSNNFSFINTSFDYQLYTTYLYHSEIVRNECINDFKDNRGNFTELMKINSAQVSMIVCNPGYFRGNHYHHNTVEHFMVLDGEMKFLERNIKNGCEEISFYSGGKKEWVTTRPGINHTIFNIGSNVLKVLCISHNIFDKNNPDTYSVI